MIINFAEEKQKREIDNFYKHGTVPESMFAGQLNSAVSNSTGVYASYLLVLEQEEALNDLYSILETHSSKFKYLYTMSKYKKGISAVDALYQEYQLALFLPTEDRTPHHSWIISEVNNRVDEILIAIDSDISSISQFLAKYKAIASSNKKELKTLLYKLTNQHTALIGIKNMHN